MDKAFRATGAAACAGIVAYWRRCIGLLTYSWLLDDTTWYCRRSFRCSPPQSGFDETNALAEMTIVRRQGFWHQELRKLRECPAHLVGFIMRRAVCDASVALRVSFV